MDSLGIDLLHCASNTVRYLDAGTVVVWIAPSDSAQVGYLFVNHPYALIRVRYGPLSDSVLLAAARAWQPLGPPKKP